MLRWISELPAYTVPRGRIDAEEEAEDERIDRDRGQRVEQRPRPAEHRPLVTSPQLAQREIDREVLRTREFPQSRHCSITLPDRSRPPPDESAEQRPGQEVHAEAG